MYQGNFGLIKNKETGETRWVWKLHVKGSKKLFYDVKDPAFTLEQTDVDEGVHSVDRPWRVVYELPAEEAFQHVQFTPPALDDIRVDSAYEIKKTILDHEAMDAFYAAQIETMKNKLHTMEKEYENNKETLERMKSDLDKIICESDTPVFCYVYGVHNLMNRTEYCWYAEGEVARKVKPGDIVCVDTVQGEAFAFVTRVERSNEYIPHKRVLKIKRAKSKDDDILPF